MIQAVRHRPLFLVPDLPHPSGGVRVLYRHVSLLRSLGHDAHIIHRTPGYRDRWCADVPNISIIPPPPTLDPAHDILVLPEIEAKRISLFRGVPTVIYCQNPFYAFLPFGQSPDDPPPPYHGSDVLAILVVSEESRRHLAHAFPRVPVLRTRNAIDPALFHIAPGPKKKQIAFMPRKLRDDVRQVLGVLRLRGVLEGWPLAPIDNLPLADVAAILQQSAVFLSFSVSEGFALPPAEAMACGCIVIGYHGIGAREYLTSHHAFPIEQGDILAFALQLEQVLRTWEADPAHFADFTTSASALIHGQYSPKNECSDVAAAWNQILRLRESRLASSSPSSQT